MMLDKEGAVRLLEAMLRDAARIHSSALKRMGRDIERGDMGAFWRDCADADEIESFYMSDWFTEITGVDGRRLCRLGEYKEKARRAFEECGADGKGGARGD